MKNLKFQEAMAHKTVLKVQYCPKNNFKGRQSNSQMLQGISTHAKHWNNMHIAILK